MRTLTLFAMATIGLAAAAAGAQPLQRTDPNIERAQTHYRLGWEALRSEDWAPAVKEFQQAIELHPKFTLAYYGLGKAFMGLRRYPDAAVTFETCRDLFVAKAGEKFSGQFDATRARQDRLMELREIDRQYSQVAQTPQVQDTRRQVQNAMQRTLEATDRGLNLNIEASAPAFVSVALGSAYFRAHRMADAEREYKSAIDADPKAGEAHNNLAVIYMLTERFAESAREVSLAEKAGFRVNPDFKKDLAERQKKK
jgi:Tfp pilus assembly protein PilF